MNKTVNSNLAGTFFHIDENAYGKLQRYLSAIRKSLIEPEGSDEIMRDIEARIAELFSEKVDESSQVISIKELDEVIAVMGQPEDYMVDEEVFEAAPKGASATRNEHRPSYKQLFRDVDNKFISGVSSGLGHYLRIDALWVRLIWILLAFITSGIAIPIYILFWILVPGAISTSDKLKMTGEPVNISNIEKKFKEGYENVADRVKNADYDKYGRQVKSGTSSFFSSLGSVLLTILNIFVKLFGLSLIFVSLITLISLVVGLFFVGSIDFWGTGEMMDYITAVMDTSMAPIWLLSVLVFLLIGIPFFVLFVIGLKIMFNNLKSIGMPAKIALVVLWIAALVGILIVGVKMTTEKAYNGEVITENTLDIRTGDTLKLYMNSDNLYDDRVYRNSGFEIKYNEDDEKVIYSNDIRLIVRSSNDSVARITIERNAEGNSFLNAKERAEEISYNYAFDTNTLKLDGFLTTPIDSKYRDQEVEVILYLPIGSILYADDYTYSFHRNNSHYRDILDNGDEGKYLLILDKATQCLDCPEPKIDASESENSWEKDSEEYRENDDWQNEVRDDFIEDLPTIENNETPTDSLTKKNN